MISTYPNSNCENGLTRNNVQSWAKSIIRKGKDGIIKRFHSSGAPINTTKRLPIDKRYNDIDSQGI